MVALGASLMAGADGTNSEIMEVIDDQVMKVEDGIFLVGMILMVIGALVVVKETAKGTAGCVKRLMRVAASTDRIGEIPLVKVQKKEAKIVYDQWGRRWIRCEGLEQEKDSLSLELKVKKDDPGVEVVMEMRLNGRRTARARVRMSSTPHRGVVAWI